MKRFFPFLLISILLVSCTTEFDQMFNIIRQGARGPKVVFQASTEGPSSPETKVYADESMKVLWNADDRISIFNQNTLNTQWAFTGDDGDTAGEFEEIPSSTFATGNPLSYIYAAYPYNKSTKMSNEGVLTMTLPAEQSWKAHSFGIGANTMMAVADGYFLAFKNVGGYISLRLYGDDVSVSRITIRGNNGEKIAGKASIEMPFGGTPAVTMDEAATEEISVVCDPAVKIGADANNYTDFWFVIPPVYFSLGFTITVTDDKGGVFEKTTSKAFTVNRNTLDWMSALKVVPNYDNAKVQFEDANFKAYCVANFDGNRDGEISVEEAKLVEAMDVCTDEIESLGGIEYFTNLKSLVCAGSLIGTKSSEDLYAGSLETINVGQNILLEELDCHGNELEELDVSNNPNLQTLICTDNPLETINLSPGQIIATLEAPEDTGIVYDWEDVIGPMSFPDANFRAYIFESFDTDQNGLLSQTECDAVTQISIATSSQGNGGVTHSLQGIGSFKNLEYLTCNGYYSPDAELYMPLAGNPRLKKVEVRYFVLTLDLGQNVALTDLSFYMTLLASLDLSHLESLAHLSCEFAGLSTLDVSHNPNLVGLNCAYNGLTSLDLSHNPLLTGLCCEANFGLTTLIFGESSPLKSLLCGGTKLASTLDLSLFPDLEILMCQDNVSTFNGTVSWTELDVSANPKLTSLKCNGNQLTTLDVSNNPALTTLECYSNPMSTLYLAAGQEITDLWKADSTEIVYKGAFPAFFPDANFRGYVFDNFDSDTNGILSQAECEAVTAINVCTDNIASLQGVTLFQNLQSLQCDASGLDLGQLSELNVSGLTSLKRVVTRGNRLTTVDVSGCTALTSLNCRENAVQSLNASGCVSLEELHCGYNGGLSSLDISGCTSLKMMNCFSCFSLADLDVSSCTALNELVLSSCGLTSLDVSSNLALTSLWCDGCPLTTLYMKTGQTISTLNLPEGAIIEYK